MSHMFRTDIYKAWLFRTQMVEKSPCRIEWVHFEGKNPTFRGESIKKNFLIIST